MAIRCEAAGRLQGHPRRRFRDHAGRGRCDGRAASYRPPARNNRVPGPPRPGVLSTASAHDRGTEDAQGQLHAARRSPQGLLRCAQYRDRKVKPRPGWSAGNGLVDRGKHPPNLRDQAVAGIRVKPGDPTCGIERLIGCWKPSFPQGNTGCVHKQDNILYAGTGAGLIEGGYPISKDTCSAKHFWRRSAQRAGRWDGCADWWFRGRAFSRRNTGILQTARTLKIPSQVE